MRFFGLRFHLPWEKRKPAHRTVRKPVRHHNVRNAVKRRPKTHHSWFHLPHIHLPHIKLPRLKLPSLGGIAKAAVSFLTPAPVRRMLSMQKRLKRTMHHAVRVRRIYHRPRVSRPRVMRKPRPIRIRRISRPRVIHRPKPAIRPRVAPRPQYSRPQPVYKKPPVPQPQMAYSLYQQPQTPQYQQPQMQQYQQTNYQVQQQTDYQMQPQNPYVSIRSEAGSGKTNLLMPLAIGGAAIAAFMLMKKK